MYISYSLNIFLSRYLSFSLFFLLSQRIKRKIEFFFFVEINLDLTSLWNINSIIYFRMRGFDGRALFLNFSVETHRSYIKR